MKKVLLALISTLLIVGCSEPQEESKVKEQESLAQEEVKTQSEVIKEQVEKVTESTKGAIEQTLDNESVERVIDKGADILDKAIAKSEEAIEKGSKALEDVKSEIHKMTAPKLDAKSLFAPCASCHGERGEREALGKSAIIAGQSKDDLISKLKGYQDGTYGSGMKALMQGQVKNLSNEEIEILAEYISTFK